MSSQVIYGGNFSGWVFGKPLSKDNYSTITFPKSLFGKDTKGIQ